MTPDPRDTWSVVVGATKGVGSLIRWTGRADGEDEAALAALAAARIGRQVIHATAGGPEPRGRCEVTDCAVRDFAKGDDRRIRIFAGMKAGSEINARRRDAKPSAEGDAALAAAAAAFQCAAAIAPVAPGCRASVNLSHDALGQSIGYSAFIDVIGYAEDELAMPASLRNALTACSFALWASGAPVEGYGHAPWAYGHASASGRAAAMAPLVAALPQNLQRVCGFLKGLGLGGVATAFRAEYGGRGA